MHPIALAIAGTQRSQLGGSSRTHFTNRNDGLHGLPPDAPLQIFLLVEFTQKLTCASSRFVRANSQRDRLNHGGSLTRLSKPWRDTVTFFSAAAWFPHAALRQREPCEATTQSITHFTLVASPVLPQPGIPDHQAIFPRTGFDLKQLDAPPPPGTPSCRISRASASARRIVRRGRARHFSPSQRANSLFGE